MNEDDDDDIGPAVPADESDAFVAGLEAAIAAWDAQAPGALNPYPEDTADHRDWEEGAHEWYENNL
jgi:hypothetical protein